MASTSFDLERGVAGGPRWSRRRLVAAGLAVFVLAGAAVAVVDDGMYAVGDGLAGSVGPEAGSAAVSGSGGDVVTGPAGSSAPVGSDEAAASADLARPAPSGVAVAPPVVPGGEPRVVKHAEMAIEVQGPIPQAFDRVADVARGQGGFVVSSSTSSFEEGPGRADLTLRVPAERFDATRAALSEVGEVRSVQVAGDDVTAQLVDLDARLRSLRAEEEALNGLLAQAGDVGEVLAVRQQVSATRMEIEQLAAQQASLEDLAAFSTLRVALTQPGAAFAGGPEPVAGLDRSLARALEGAVAVVGGMVVVAGYAGPFLVLGLLAWAGQKVARLRRRPA
ncbi:MAG: DUF4349 domain-containing protein [Actinobacteria bacterium]|nr:DUF4349 domain-containing protein [Actinomycetota bacterium]